VECLDGECFHSKINAHIDTAKAGIANIVQISTTWRPAKDKPTAELSPTEYRVIGNAEQDSSTVPTCENATPAIVTYGHSVGTIHLVCADQDCAVHHPRRLGPTAAGRTDDAWEKEIEERRLEADRRKDEKEQREKRLRNLILRMPSSGTEEQMRFVLSALVTGDLDDSVERIARRLEGQEPDHTKSSDDVCAEAISTCMPSSLFGYLAELALGSWIDLPRPEEPDYLAEAEKLFPNVQKTTADPARRTPVKAAKKTYATKTAAKKAAAKSKRR